MSAPTAGFGAKTWAAAACAAMAVAGLCGFYFMNRSEAAALHDEVDLANIALRRVVGQIEAERILHRRELAVAGLDARTRWDGDLARLTIATLIPAPGNPSRAMAVVVWDPQRQRGALQVAGLPSPAPDEDYRLWVDDPQYPSPVDGGVFHVDPASGGARIAFKAARPIGSARSFTVSLERGGGAAERLGPIVLQGD